MLYNFSVILGIFGFKLVTAEKRETLVYVSQHIHVLTPLLWLTLHPVLMRPVISSLVLHVNSLFTCGIHSVTFYNMDTSI